MEIPSGVHIVVDCVNSTPLSRTEINTNKDARARKRVRVFILFFTIVRNTYAQSTQIMHK